MSIFTKEKRGNYLFILSLLVAKFSLVAVIGISAFDGYIRWSINQNFTLLGGFELEALTVCSFGLLFSLNYFHKSGRE